MNRPVPGVPSRLRPAKVRNAVRRRAFERSLGRLTPAAHPGTEELGTAYGGWVLPAAELQRGWTAYCVGAGGDVATDLILRRRWDMTVRCVEPVAVFCEQARAEAGPDPSFTVHRAAIMPADGPVTMRLNPHPGAQSLSASGLYLGKEESVVDGRSLPSLMAELGDPRIDLLKLDVEGAEYDVLPTLDLRALGVRVLATQLHHNGGLRAGRRLVAAIEAQGFRLVGHREVVKLTFLATSPPPPPRPSSTPPG